jgi:tricorn protease
VKVFVFPVCLAALVLALPAAAAPTRLLRTPAVSPNHIAFAYASNIWVVERGGGQARRITSFQGQSSNPHFSPDGKWLAFSADYAGNTDVYLVPVEGGDPKRLTFHPGADVAQGWTPDGKSVLFISARSSSAPIAAPRFWTVPASGGIEEALALPRGYQGKLSPSGTHIAYRMNNSWDDERRNYRGGQNRPIWIVDLKTFDLVSPPWTDSKDIDPVWLSDSAVAFLSDRDGVSNVWSYDTKSKKLSQLTRYADFDVKSLNASGGTLVFEQAGYVHALDAKTAKSQMVNITAAGDFPWMMPRWEDVTNRMSNLAVSPTGKRIAVEARGEIFTIPSEKGDTRNLTNSSGAADRYPAWSPDGKFVSYFSDRSGEYKLVIEAQDGISPAREIAIPNPTHFYTPAWSPDSKKLLYTDSGLKVWVLDIETGQTKSIGNDPWMVPARTLNPTWSPDSKWVAYASRLRSLYHAIFIANVETGASQQITDGLADSVWPVWDASGKYLWFLASTDFGLRSQWLDMTSYDHDVNFGLYLAILNRNDPSPLLPESDEDSGLGAPVRTDKPSASPVTVQIDFEGLSKRILAVPGIPVQQYSRLLPGVAGTVFYLQASGRLANGGAAGGSTATLQRYRRSERKAAPFASGVSSYQLSADGRKLAYTTVTAAVAPALGTPSLFLVDADKPAAPAVGQGRLTATLRMNLDPREEFKQIFYEGWRNQRDYLYVPNMQGTDWARMKEMYGSLLPHVMHRSDLTYLLDNMGAEIAVGHSYVRGGDVPAVPNSRAGLLGADFVIENGFYKISRIYDTESWNPELSAPLAVPGANVTAGDYVLAINGTDLKAPDSIYRLLDGTVGRQTVLLVNNRPALEGARRITVIPIANEQGLRGRAWVEDNRRLVDKLSGGKLAYVHVPNTGQPGYASFNRYYFAQQDKQGAIIDERYNGGGSAADYIVDVLGRDFDGYFNNVAGDRYPFTSPSAGIWGAKVMIINEMAGSGGDLMPWMFQRRKIGPLVGKRTWGGLVHTADSPVLVDGGTMIAPRGGFFTREGKWAVENEGTAPDIDVENWPKDMIAGKDAQLEAAVKEALRLLALKPVQRMTTEPPPPTWGQRKTPLK